VVGEIGQRHHAGVVHEHVDRTVSVDSLLRRRFDLRHIRHIRNMSRAFEAGRLRPSMTSFRLSALMSTPTTFAPPAAHFSEMRLPKPLPAPVTMMTLSFRYYDIPTLPIQSDNFQAIPASVDLMSARGFQL